jgi:outer membrane protein
MALRFNSLLPFCAVLLCGIPCSGEDLWQRIKMPYSVPQAPPVSMQDSVRLEDLIKAGQIYLTLDDAVKVAVANNLDVELQRFNWKAARTEIERAKGGGLLRGISYNVLQAPAGVGGPTTSLQTSSATSRSIPGTSVSTNPLEVGALGQIQTNLSITGGTPYSNGTSVPNYEPILSGRFLAQHQSALQNNVFVAGLPNLVTDTLTFGPGFRQSYSTGTTLAMSWDNMRQTTNSVRASYTPYYTSALNAILTQPLLRGFGMKVNRRFIRSAENEQKIADQLFRQQLTDTVYGVTRLYLDLFALQEDVRVKRDTLELARKLFAETKQKVAEGALAQVELARANAQVFSAQLDLERSMGLAEEQEAILRSVLSKRGSENPTVRAARIVTSKPQLPEAKESELDSLMSAGLQRRPDINQAELQVSNSELSLEGSRNNVKPQLDIVAGATNNGLAGATNPLVLVPDTSLVGDYGTALGQVFRRNYPTYSVGLQLDLPLRNRVAQSDLARDEIIYRQTQVRMQQLRNAARLEIEDATIAIRRARSAYAASVQARLFQEEALQAEEARFDAGVSTSNQVIQAQNLLAQARSTEVAARSALAKATAALQRATASILDDFGISVDTALEANH